MDLFTQDPTQNLLPYDGAVYTIAILHRGIRVKRVDLSFRDQSHRASLPQ
jgi:hypothetical protein